jgi:hypothetical protein
MRLLVSACLLSVAGAAHGQGNFMVVEADLPRLKLNHYFTPDKRTHNADFNWTFTKTEFSIKKGTEAIPKHLGDTVLPAGTTAKEITGKWELKDGKLKLTEIMADGKATEMDASLPIFKTAPTVVRICDPNQVVFGIEK